MKKKKFTLKMIPMFIKNFVDFNWNNSLDFSFLRVVRFNWRKTLWVFTITKAGDASVSKKVEIYSIELLLSKKKKHKRHSESMKSEAKGNSINAHV